MSLTIISENIYWFSGAPFGGEPPGELNPHIVSGLADVWRAHSPDVICLQEVPSKLGYDLVRAAFEERSMPSNGIYLPGVEIAGYGGAVFYRSGKYVTDSKQAGAETQRIWQVFDVPYGANDTLRIANVHLPSNRRVTPEEGEKLRIEELTTMLSIVGQPDIICGDFNNKPYGAVWNLLTERGFSDAAELAGQPDSVTTLGGNRIDYHFLADRIADRLDAYGVIPKHEIATTVPNRSYLSDHLPVWIKLREPQ